VTPGRFVTQLDALPLHSRTPVAWGRSVLLDPLPLLVDHAFLEKKAASNAMELLTRVPEDPVWVETMSSVARDEAAHLAQVTRLVTKRGGCLTRDHKNPYASALRMLVRRGEREELLDRLLVAALIEARSCERFAVLAATAADNELATFYARLFSSELGHYQVFLHLAARITGAPNLDARWQTMLAAEARILSEQAPGPRIHSGSPV
jgi:tRNA 2-(methylsulfanyl)-N6-isopentenyladenosine37 hydroxylase